MRMQIRTGGRAVRARNTAECFHRGRRTRGGKRKRKGGGGKRAREDIPRAPSISKCGIKETRGKRTRGTKPRGNQNAKGKSWKLYDYLAVPAQVQALPPVLSHLELDPRENMPCNNHAGLSGKTFSRDRRCSPGHIRLPRVVGTAVVSFVHSHTVYLGTNIQSVQKYRECVRASFVDVTD